MESQQTHTPSDQVGEWQPFATFTVELQERQVKGQTERRTMVSHLQANAGAYWPGIENLQLHHWIMSQLNQVVPSEEKAMAQSEFAAESRQAAEVGASSIPEVETETEPVAERPFERLAEGQLESATELQSAVETASPPTPTAEVQPESELLIQPEAAADQSETATEGQVTVEPDPQPMLVAEVQPESEALIKPELTAEKSPAPVSEPEPESEAIIQSMPAPTPLSESKAETAGTKAAATSTAVEIIQLQAVQPPQSGLPMMFDKAGPLRMKSILSGHPFALEVSFKLSGTGAGNVAEEQAPYHSAFYVCNRTTGETFALGKTPRNTLVEGEVAYTSRLPEAILQKPGMYRLQVVTELAEDLASPDYFEVPLLKVV